MGLLDLFKRTASGQTTPLSTTQVDSNWQKIMDLFPTPAAGTTDVGKVPALKADKTGFNYAPVISSIIPGANISIDVTDPNNPVISAISNAMQSSKYLIAGGSVWSGTGLTYDVTALEYYFNGDKNTSATQVTLDASDPVNNRLDAIVVDEAGVVSVIKGDASASPISPSVDESHILIQYILVEAGSTQPTIAKEDIYLENVEWTTSTYTTGTATGSIDFDNAVSPKQGVKCISANADARLGARFVRTTSFDPYQYTMLSMWVRFTGSNVATNKSLNVRFENGAGALVANTINLFNFGLQRNLLNVWQLVVVPMSAFGALPTTVKGFKMIMAGGTVGQARQWDIDLISLTDNSVPAINEQVFNVLKDGALVGQSSSLNFKGGSVNVTKDVTGGKIDVEVIGSGGGTWGSITGILSNQTDLQTALNGKVDENAAITGATKTKITYDSKGLVTSGADATTADIADSTNKRYVTDANLVVIGNTSGTNTGDNATNSQYSGLAASKQDTLVSGTNIKTINSNSLLGSGDLVITAGDGNDDFMLVASFKSLYNY